MATLLTLLLAAGPAAGLETGAVGPEDAYERAPWLDVPAAWSRTLQGQIVAVVPDDLPHGRSFLLLVEPPVASTTSLAADYDGALTDLGPWTPVGQPIEDAMASGWIFRQGVGVTRLEGVSYTALTAVGRQGGLRARFWALADSDDTFNRYKSALANAIVSVQSSTQATATVPPPHAAASAPVGGATSLGPDFGSGLSGVYVGLERGLGATTGAGPGTLLAVSDSMEVDVLFPDGTYRRRLPIRGLGADLDWERRQQPGLWGRWSRQGDLVTIQREGYSTSYTVQGGDLVSDRSRIWTKLAPIRNVRLEGSFARDDYRDPSAPRLILHADGSYEDRGRFLRMIGSASNLVVPDGDAMVGRWTQAEVDRAMAGGSGTYSFDAFTLSLHDRDGRIWQINAYLPPGESPPSPRRLVINGRALVLD